MTVINYFFNSVTSNDNELLLKSTFPTLSIRLLVLSLYTFPNRRHTIDRDIAIYSSIFFLSCALRLIYKSSLCRRARQVIATEETWGYKLERNFIRVFGILGFCNSCDSLSTILIILLFPSYFQIIR